MVSNSNNKSTSQMIKENPLLIIPVAIIMAAVLVPAYWITCIVPLQITASLVTGMHTGHIVWLALSLSTLNLLAAKVIKVKGISFANSAISLALLSLLLPGLVNFETLRAYVSAFFGYELASWTTAMLLCNIGAPLFGYTAQFGYVDAKSPWVFTVKFIKQSVDKPIVLMLSSQDIDKVVSQLPKNNAGEFEPTQGQRIHTIVTNGVDLPAYFPEDLFEMESSTVENGVSTRTVYITRNVTGSGEIFLTGSKFNDDGRVTEIGASRTVPVSVLESSSTN